MKHALLFAPHPNARYDAELKKLCAAELSCIAAGMGIAAPFVFETVGGLPLFTVEWALTDRQKAALLRASSLLALFALEGNSLTPLMEGFSRGAFFDMPAILKYKGKTISEVLEMTVEEGVEFFQNIPKIKRKLQTLYDVGLGYIKIGQPSTELSGGEAQRVKLATELSKKSTGKTIYILDEPTTGLHTADIHKLIEVLNQLVEGDNTVVVIEHNLDVIKTADHIIDLGPEGGDKGGTIVATGTPEDIASCENSYTGYFLKKLLEKNS